MTQSERHATALGAAACLALVVPAAVVALPPGGVDETPGTPPGSVSIVQPEVAKQGKVGFCVRNYRVNLPGGGSVGQKFMLKFDDFGAYGIGPFEPDNNGDLCAEVSMNPADHAGAQGGAADKIPPGLCDPTKEHWLRFLSGSWAYNQGGVQASSRSQSAAFTVTANCSEPAADGTPAPAPGGAGGGNTVVPIPQVISRTVGTNGRTLTLRFQSVTAHTVVSVGLRTRTKVRVGRQMRVVRLVSATRIEIPADGRSHTATLRLTPTGRRVLSSRGARASILTVTPATGKARGLPLNVIRSGK